MRTEVNCEEGEMPICRFTNTQELLACPCQSNCPHGCYGCSNPICPDPGNKETVFVLSQNRESFEKPPLLIGFDGKFLNSFFDCNYRFRICRKQSWL